MNNKEKTHTEGDNPYNDLAKFLQVTQQSQPQLHSQMPAHPELLHHLLLNTQQNPQALAALLQQQKQQQQQQQQALAMPQYLGLSGQPFMQYLGMPGLGGNPEQQKLIGFAGIPHSGNGVDNSVLLNTLLTQQQQQQQQQQAMFQQANKGGFAGGNAVNPFGGNNLFPSPQQLFQQQAPSSSGSGIGSFVPSDNFTQLKEQQQQLQLLQKFEQQQQLQQLQQQFQLSQQQQQQQQKQLISSQQQQQAQAQQQQQLLLIQQQLQQSQQLQDSNGSVQQNGIFINEAYLAQQKALQAQLLYQQQQNQQQAAAGAVGVANNLDNMKSSQKITIEDDEDNNEKDEQPRDISGQIQQNQTHVLYNQQSKISTTHVSGGQSSQQQQQIIEVEESSIPDQFPFLNSKNAIIPSKKDSRNIKSSPQKQNQNDSDSDLQEDNQSGQQIQQQSKKERRENPEISFSEGNSPQKGLKRGKKNEINSQMQLKRASGKNEQANVDEDSEDEGDEQSEEGESQGNHMSSKQDAKHKRKSKEGSNLLEESKNNSSKKTCSNLFCRNNPYPLKPANSKRHEGKVYWFCPQCLECYNKGFHCDYCEQVYENNESCADVKEWVGCERCFKWNHVDCEAAFRNDNKIKKIYKSKDFKYYCLKCETKRNKKSTNGVQTTSESPQKFFKGSVMNGQQQIAQVGQTNTVFSKKTRGNGNNLLNSNQKQSEDSHITDGKQSIEKRKALTPSRRRLQNASTSQVPSENDKNSVDFKPPRNFQNNDSKSDGDSNYYDISIPYKKRKETQNGKGANHLEETYQLFKKKYHMVYPHPSFNFLQYHLHELSFGVKLSLNEETIRGDLDRLRCCVDEEFKAKYDEEMRIKEEHKKKKEEQDLERQKLIQQRKLLQQQRLKMREEQENDGEDNVNGENNSGDAEDDEEEDDEDIENQSQQQQQPEETESRVRRYATRRHQDLLENKHKKDHNNNGNDNDQLSGDYHGQKLRDGSQERRIGRKITRNNKRNVPTSSNNHNKYEDSGNNDNNNQKQQSEQKKLENGNQKKYENSKTDENKQKDDETKQSMISEGNLSNKEEVLQKQQQQQISDQSEAQSRQNGKESEDVNGKIDEIGRSTRSTRGGLQHEQNSSLSAVSSGVRSTRNNQASQQTKS